MGCSRLDPSRVPGGARLDGTVSIIGGTLPITRPLLPYPSKDQRVNTLVCTPRLSICLEIVLCSAASAQDSDSDQWAALKQLNSGETVQIVQITLESQTGIIQSVSNEAVFFRVGQEERSVARLKLLRLTVIDRSSRKRNTVLGLAIGTAAGLAGGGALASAAGWFDEGTGSKPAVAIAGLGAGGAVAGYAWGRHRVHVRSIERKIQMPNEKYIDGTPPC